MILPLVCACVALCAAAGVKPVDRKAPHRLTVEQMTGCRIGVMESYNHLEDGALDSVACHLGLQMNLSPWIYENGTVDTCIYALTSSMNSYALPVEIDLENRRAYLYACRLDSSTVSAQHGRYSYDTVTTVYMFPEVFLQGETYVDELSSVEGIIHDDGSITFDQGFLYYIEQVTYKTINTHLVDSDTVCTLSAVYRDLSLLIPNGKHTFTRGTHSVSVTDEGASDLNTEIHVKGLASYILPFNRYRCFPNGIGGAVGTPIDPRPIRPGIIWNGGYVKRMSAPGRWTTDSMSNKQTVPVYMFQPDDSTLLVYNLYGESRAVNRIVLHDDGTMTLPGQQIGYDIATSAAIYNCSQNEETGEVELGNQGIAVPDTLMWGMTLPYTEQGLLSYDLDGNKLSFTDGSQFMIPVALKLGDVNMDGMLTIKDLTIFIDRLLKGDYDESDDFNPVAADVTCDDYLGIGDVTRLVDLLLSGQ